MRKSYNSTKVKLSQLSNKSYPDIETKTEREKAKKGNDKQVKNKKTRKTKI